MTEPDMEAKRHTDNWREPIPEAHARRALGDGHFDYCLARSAAFCAGRARGAWDANLVEEYGAYRTVGHLAAILSAPT